MKDSVQWCSSVPKSKGGHKLFSQKVKSKKKKIKKKIKNKIKKFIKKGHSGVKAQGRVLWIGEGL